MMVGLSTRQSTKSAPPRFLSTRPADVQGTSTGDTYSATLIYNGTNLALNLYDVTAGGSCPGSSCFTYTWNDVNIPS